MQVLIRNLSLSLSLSRCKMMNRLLSRHCPLRILTLISPKTPNPNPNPNPSSNFFYLFHPRHFSTNNKSGHRGDTSDWWRLSTDTDVFEGIDEKPGNDVFEGIGGGEEVRGTETSDSWRLSVANDRAVGDEKKVVDVFEGIGEKAWTLGGEKVDDVFDLREDERVEIQEGDDGGGGDESVAIEKKRKEDEKLEEEEKMLTAVLKGPNRAFGDLIAASGITDEMLDSLMALKDLGGVQGLPPLREIEDMRYEKNTRKSSRADIERQKQEEVAKARVRQVDDKGRAYGTGRRKCSVARVWIQPGEGKFVVNDKEFDVYFPMLDHRAALLRPFSETKTLGLWDVSCTVKGGGVSGQVGAVQLGISKALQNWEPNLRPPLRAVGFLTRDSRVVERKKPGKAKARKSFQWVKR